METALSSLPGIYNGLEGLVHYSRGYLHVMNQHECMLYLEIYKDKISHVVTLPFI